MKILRKILFGILVLMLVFAIAFFVYRYSHTPKYEGEISLKGIRSETTVYFDDFGIPHIYAASQKDAMTALGYVHAQDRLWQMELLRRIAPGRLSEIFGTKALKNDKFFAGIGIDEASEKSVAQLDKNSESVQLAQAYLDGINQFQDEGPTPVEFSLIGVKKEKFTLKDVYNIFGFMSFSFAMAQKTDPLLTTIRDKYGMGYLKDLGIGGSFNATQIKNYKAKTETYTEISKSVATLLDQSPVPPFVGSNSWVLGPQKTKKGMVIFANDPHIGFSQPGTWYEAHIVTPDYEVYGYYLAGTPFPLLGHNRHYAYGLTMFENDDVDFFREENNPANPAQYKTAGSWSDYRHINKRIRVKDSSDVNLEIRTTIHGPLVNGLLDGLDEKSPIAMSWVYTKEPIKVLDAVYHLSHAKNMEDFHHWVGLIAAPGLNVMYGDAKGNIGWFASGKLYKLDKSVNPNFVLSGSNGIDDRKTPIDFPENPSAQNPPWHYVYSANNQPEAINGYLYPGYYLPQDRAKRITGLLDAKNDWDLESIGAMITDSQSAVAPSVVSDLLSVIGADTLGANESKAASILKKWDGSNGPDDIAPTIYNKFLYKFLENTYKDELGQEDFTLFLGTHLVKQVIAPQMKNDTSLWWDDIATKNIKETRKAILEKSFKEAIASLEKQLGSDLSAWNWGRVHSVEFQHPLGKVAALRPFFNVGPFAIGGSNEVINNQFFTYTGEGKYEVKGGPSTRRIIDFSDIGNSRSILPTGQSGNVFSPHYHDQAKMYAEGRFRKMKLDKQEIVKSSTRLVFHPKG